MIQFAKYQGNTFSSAQMALAHETKGFVLVVLCQKCNPRLNHAQIYGTMTLVPVQTME